MTSFLSAAVSFRVISELVFLHSDIVRTRYNQVRLRDITFGFASADFEATHDPDLLLSGFVDHMQLVDKAKNGRKFLFLGYKGSGKSALGEHLKLLAQSDPQMFVQFVNIADVS